MKRYKKAICLILIFALSLSLFVVPAGAVIPETVIAGVGLISGVVAIVEFVTPAMQAAGNWIKDQFVSTFIGVDLTDVDIGDGDYAVGYVFKAYREDKVYTPGTSVLVSFESLSQLTLTLNSYGISSTLTTNTVRTTDGIKTYWFVTPHSEDIIRQANLQGGTTNGKVWLCNQSGYPYHAAASTDNTTSTNTNYNYYTQEGSPTTNNEYNYNSGDTVNNPIFKYGDEVTENNQVYDYSSDSYVEVGDISYDASTKQYTTNITIDNSVHVQYNIDHTSITYIGSSAEDKTYNLYYELPDGRNSSELTAEDLEQLVLNYNVINYGVSADDGRLRALYHFDGNTEDSSYWSTYSNFEWNVGASLTYLESNAFGGSLYLDENAHQFTVTLPGNLSASDFSVFFRFYQSASTNESGFTVNIGSDNLWIVSPATTSYFYAPTGQWNELGIIRDGGTRYVYLNGVLYSSTPGFTSTFGNSISLNFERSSSYRQIDELRVYNFALYEGGENYTPVTTPVDTNAVLILPDQAIPVPDGYWDFNTDGNLLTYQDFSNGVPYNILSSTGGNTYDYGEYYFSLYPFPTVGQFYYNQASPLSLTTYSDYAHISYSDPSFYNFDASSFLSDFPSHPYIRYYNSGDPSSLYNVFGIRSEGAVPPLFSYLGCVSPTSLPSSYNPYGISLGDTLSFSFVDPSGNQYSSTIHLPSSIPNFASLDPSVADIVDTEWGTFGLVFSRGTLPINANTQIYSVQLIFAPSSSGSDFVYMEFKKGSPNDNSDSYVTEIYSDIDLTMPTVAIRSQIPIREYRIGGVRPTVPYRGDVWMMVENSHITSVQIYTGFAWQEVDLRIWTGQRWVSALYYNIMTQQDYTDILGTTDNEYIQSTEGFYSWLTKQFKELLAVLNEISDQLEDIDSGGGTSLDFTFEVGDITVEFTKLSDDGRDGLLTITQPFYEVVFAELGTIYEGVLDDFSLLFSTSDDTVTIDGETGYTFWYIFNAPEEVWNVRSVR